LQKAALWASGCGKMIYGTVLLTMVASTAAFTPSGRAGKASFSALKMAESEPWFPNSVATQGAKLNSLR
jgi:hypothetical protein